MTSEQPKQDEIESPIHIRWMIRRDMPEVSAIEEKSFDFPWSEEEFIRCLRQRNCVGMVAERDDKVVGFMIYELHKNRLHLLNFAVDPAYRREGVGSAMLEKLTSKLSHKRRHKITLETRESNLPAQLFLKKNGFRAISVLRDFYEDTTEDAYLMQHRLPELAKTVQSIEDLLSKATGGKVEWQLGEYNYLDSNQIFHPIHNKDEDTLIGIIKDPNKILEFQSTQKFVNPEAVIEQLVDALKISRYDFKIEGRQINKSAGYVSLRFGSLTNTQATNFQTEIKTINPEVFQVVPAPPPNNQLLEGKKKISPNNENKPKGHEQGNGGQIMPG